MASLNVNKTVIVIWPLEVLPRTLSIYEYEIGIMSLWFYVVCFKGFFFLWTWFVFSKFAHPKVLLSSRLPIVCVAPRLNNIMISIKYIIFVTYFNPNIVSFYSPVTCKLEISDHEWSWMMKWPGVWNTFGLKIFTWWNNAETICE